MPLGPLMASCSPVGGKGRLVPTTWVSLSAAKTVEVSVWMPVHIWASMPSCGGREGINGMGVSHCPEANRSIASFVYYSNRRNRKKIHRNHQLRKRDNFYRFSSGRTMQWQCCLPPLIVGDSRYSAAKPKARRPSDPILPPTREKRKKGS